MRARTYAAVLVLLATLFVGDAITAAAAHAGIPPTWQRYKNYHSNLCISPEDYVNYSRVFQYPCADTTMWRFKYVRTNANGTPLYLIENMIRGCLEYTGDIGTSSNARIYPCINSGARSRQLWWFAGPNGKATIRTVNKDSNGLNLCLEIEDSSREENTMAQLWTCSGQAGSFWNIQYRES
jgi:Ricin-type beta-trefoil lectin domain